VIKPSSKDQFCEIIQNLVKDEAEGIILGCTEIPLLITQEDVKVPLFDTTRIHAEFAVEYALIEFRISNGTIHRVHGRSEA